MTTVKYVVDPPSGWMYGFPKAFDHDPNVETVEEWYVRNGYPQQLIDQGMLRHVRYWDFRPDKD